MITAHDMAIQNLVEEVRVGRLLLPEIQRGYVWKAPQVRNLFDSLYRGYPSGQLLVWQTDDLPSMRAVSLGDLDGPQRRPQLLLDGQQRLTSLSAVMLGKPLMVRDSKRPIDIVFNVYTEQFAIAGPQTSGAGWVSLSKLFTQGPLVLLQELQLDMADPESKNVFERLNRIDNIKKYTYRVIVLDNIPYEEVTDIFVRINSAGTTLGSADLALAQISSRWHGVTQVLTDYQRHVWNRHSIWVDTGLFLRTMSLLLTGQSRLSQFFRGDYKKISVQQLQDAWQRTREGLDRALEFLIHNCKIDRLDLLPSHYMLVAIAAFFDRFGANVTPQQARDLQRWVYLALIWARYSGTTESALDQDYAALGKDTPIHTLIQNIEDRVGLQREITERELQEQRKNSPYMVMSYVLARYARSEDWFNGVQIGGGQPLELHHIFPKAVLKERYDLRADSRIVDQVANLAFLSQKANARISSKEPAEYLPTIDARRLQSQYVPLDPALWTLDRFDEFVQQRRQMLAQGINELLLSLSDEPVTPPPPDLQRLAAQIEGLEHRLRDLVADRLIAARGEAALEHCVPREVRRNIEHRRDQRIARNPFEAPQFTTLYGLFEFCQFSDYAKIMRDNWPLFADLFGKGDGFEQHIRAVTSLRNSVAHNNALSRSDLLLGQAGLAWIEDCLRNVDQSEEGEDAEAEDEVVT